MGAKGFISGQWDTTNDNVLPIAPDWQSAKQLEIKPEQVPDTRDQKSPKECM